jgi:MFS family permease
MILAAVYGLVPVYARESGMTFSEVGTLMAVIIFGGLSLQWPVGHWADQGNRRRVLYVASFLTTLFGLAIPLLDSVSHPFFFILAWFFGGFAFTLYPLSMAYTCEGVKENQIVAATGGFVLSYGIGAIAGPLIAPFVMSFLGSGGLFYFLAFISLGLGLFGIKCRAKQTFP